ncbi:hypothetical protein W97_08405 [Coniosporium apollinis CBS 100218]|uniref:DNA-directed DNA polymerase n=1 Tax=Coniosporium apollinis (strain CBS 100218) TaxID=1168221 RepID=R7Z4L7_CONA1|nr:uncharacterized protein W97_08405 [Coniosporium apollinis CBS 100218]EON69092.1 hypothetical protein W97_08405 [Coniosporium apollinis CBS 100218]
MMVWDRCADIPSDWTRALHVLQSVALSNNEMLDLGRNTSLADDARFEGGYVVPLVLRCYKGVIVIDGNSLYESLMSKLQIFVDRCISAMNSLSLQSRPSVALPEEAHNVTTGEREVVFKVVAVVQDGPTMLGQIINELISLRKEGEGEQGRHHELDHQDPPGQYLQRDGEQARDYILEDVRGGYHVRGQVKGMTPDECMELGMKLRETIDGSMQGTPFVEIRADIKGNYKTILITAGKNYAVVGWDGNTETKGMTPVKKDTLPIAKYAATKVLDIINSNRSHMDRKIMRVSVLVDIGLESMDVDKRWVLDRITGAVATILEAADMNDVRGLIFSYNMAVK